MLRVLLIVGLAILLYFFFRWLSRQSPTFYWRSIGILAGVALLALVLTGRAHWLTAVFAALLPFVRVILNLLGNLPLLKKVLDSVNKGGSTEQAGSGQSSTVHSEYLRMSLSLDTGDIAGEVLKGRFVGRTLDSMPLEDLLHLLDECIHDEESVTLLQAYLDRVHGEEWRQQAGEQGEQRSSGPGDNMSPEEAFEILGLEPGASEEEIIRAHRRLMQLLHPDRGGTTYFAARINQAKDTLLKRER